MRWLIQSWTGRRSEWTSVSPREPTPPHLESTWADPQAPVTGPVGTDITGTDTAGGLPVRTDDGLLPHGLDIATGPGPGVTLHVVITEKDRAGKD